jgi:hypothetical protein
MIFLMQTPALLSEVLQEAIVPALIKLPRKFNSKEAQLLMLAIGNQESRYRVRLQVNGPAHGFWQFELPGVAGVFHQSQMALTVGALCLAREVAFSAAAVYAELLVDDILAAGFARLLLWSDPHPLPALEDEEGAWECYIRNWRPGQPNRGRWVNSYGEAMKEFNV